MIKELGKYFDSKRKIFEMDYRVSYSNPVSLIHYGINEGLIRTYPFETMERYICSYFNIPKYYFHEYESNGVKCCAIDIPNKKTYIDDLDKAMNLCGYFNSTSRFLEDGKIKRVHYEPKFEPKNEYNGEVLYHIAHVSNLSKIMKLGLCPYDSKNDLFFYENRVYLFKQNATREDFINYCIGYKRTHKEKYGNAFAILKILASNLPNTIEFHEDPNMDNAVYTSSNISPQFIEIEDFIVNP